MEKGRELCVSKLSETQRNPSAQSGNKKCREALDQASQQYKHISG